jgi:hypothetical protein
MYSLQEFIMSPRSENFLFVFKFDLKTLESKTKPRGESVLTVTYARDLSVNSLVLRSDYRSLTPANIRYLTTPSSSKIYENILIGQFELLTTNKAGNVRVIASHGGGEVLVPCCVRGR